MELWTAACDYNVAAFYKTCCDYLPQLVVVTQGFYGEIIEDTFDQGQVIYLRTVSHQKRVVAKSHGKLLSIPLSYPEKLCVVNKDGKVSNKEKSIDQIATNTKLPCTVQFPRDKIIRVTNRDVSTNHMSSLKLLETFDEMYFLGNMINDGVMCQEVIAVPLYLTQLKMTQASGIKGASEDQWKAFLSELKVTAGGILYDQEYGQQDIAFYDAKTTHSETSYSAYSYVEPTMYTSILSIMKRSSLESGDHLYDELSTTPVKIGQQTTTRAAAQKPETRPTKAPVVAQKPLTSHTTPAAAHDQTSRPLSDSFSNVYDELSPYQTKTTGAPKLPGHVSLQDELKSKLKKPAIATPTESNPSRDFASKQDRRLPEPPGVDGAPIVPKRLPNMHTTTKGLNTPTAQRPYKSSDMNDYDERVSISSASSDIATRQVKESADVAKLTIDEVCVYLDRLKLGEYAADFRQEMVDGQILLELDKDVLVGDFHMKTIQALRLVKFAKEGHVPT